MSSPQPGYCVAIVGVMACTGPGAITPTSVYLGRRRLALGLWLAGSAEVTQVANPVARIAPDAPTNTCISDQVGLVAGAFGRTRIGEMGEDARGRLLTSFFPWCL
jgi:hypothetical protein